MIIHLLIQRRAIMLAKCKGEYRILQVDKDEVTSLFISPIKETDVLKKFDAETKCETDEWLFIDVGDHKNKMILPYLDMLNSPVQFNMIDAKSCKEVSLLINRIENSENLIFKKITKSKHIQGKIVLGFLGIELRNEKINSIKIPNGIVIDESIDAYYDGEKNILYFKDFARIHTFFNGIDSFYREATAEEVSKFRKTTCLDISGYNKNMSKRNLKLIGIINDSENIDLNDEGYIKRMMDHSESFETITLEIRENKFVINNEDDLNQFLRLALGRFYINPLTSDKMVASTAQVVK